MEVVGQVTVGLAHPENLDGSPELNTATGVGAVLVPALVTAAAGINTLSATTIGQLYQG